MKRKQYDDDDGRQIADMSFTHRTYIEKAEHGLKPDQVRTSEQQAGEALSKLSRRETWGIIFGALKAGLLIGLIFVGGAALFILFCIYVWFK
jgi:hypothetical protein